MTSSPFPVCSTRTHLAHRCRCERLNIWTANSCWTFEHWRQIQWAHEKCKTLECSSRWVRVSSGLCSESAVLFLVLQMCSMSRRSFRLALVFNQRVIRTACEHPGEICWVSCCSGFQAAFGAKRPNFCISRKRRRNAPCGFWRGSKKESTDRSTEVFTAKHVHVQALRVCMSHKKNSQCSLK